MPGVNPKLSAVTTIGCVVATDTVRVLMRVIETAVWIWLVTPCILTLSVSG